MVVEELDGVEGREAVVGIEEEHVAIGAKEMGVGGVKGRGVEVAWAQSVGVFGMRVVGKVYGSPRCGDEREKGSEEKVVGDVWDMWAPGG